MPFPSKRRSAMTENSEKGRISITTSELRPITRSWTLSTEENRQLRAQLEEQKVLQVELRSALERAEQREHSLELPSLARLAKG
ncbi:hypothetical protein L596_026307 [Steinernema carpocapsae]|uniref:Uncharacterized protein n=1 Tax=Steinernema carpocapsae TaxID=34508 RepID=A0A4U5M0Z0_STECR|nr:hypothetical protein L596_026307 [Steinernema carpocapsae]